MTYRIPVNKVHDEQIGFLRKDQDLRDEVVDEPGNRDGRQVDPVTADDQKVGHLATNHGVLLVASGLLHAKTPDEDRKSRNDTKPERQAPDSPKMVLAKNPEEDQWDEGSDYETEVNHRICGMQGYHGDTQFGADSFYSLVARANQRCWAFLLMPGSSDCSDAATEPHGYSAPTPIPSRKLANREHVSN